MVTKKIVITACVVLVGLLIAAFLWWLWSSPQASKNKIIDVVDKLPKHPTKKYAQRQIKDIRKLVIHHSACIGNNCDAAAYAKFHVNSRGWAGIGYHYIIEKDGTIKQTNRDTTVSYHCSGQNAQALGISLSGDFTREQLLPAQRKALVWLCKHLRQQYGNLEITKHNDFAPTACPGQIGFESIKAEVLNLA